MVGDNRTIDTLNPLIIFCQNICGLRKGTDELINSLFQNFPHILCLSEHHLKQFELNQINLDGYKHCATYYIKFIEKAGVCIVYKILNYLNINLL
jgi:exonuclease III